MNTETPQQQDVKVGEILRRARVHYNQSLADVENALRIRAVQIEAIEKGEFHKLPGRVYAMGFIRSYAEYLGLDGDRMIELFKQQAGIREPRPELHFPAVTSDNKAPPVKLVMAAAAGALILIGMWWGMQDRNREIVDEIPPVPVAAAPQAPPSQEVAKPDDSALEAPPPKSGEQTENDPVEAAQPAPKGIILSMNENSWVEIKDSSGKAIVARVLNAGEKYYVPDRPDLRMSIGNSGGIKIEVDGVLLRPLGKQGDVRRNVPLDAEYLKKNFASPDQPESQNSDKQASGISPQAGSGEPPLPSSYSQTPTPPE